MEGQESIVYENEDDSTFESVAPPVKSRILIFETVLFLVFFTWSTTECALLGTHNATNETEVIEKLVQSYAAKFFMAKTIVESLLPALISMFIGPWSDKFGRKPLIVTTIIGYFIIYSSITVISYLSTVMSVSPWFYLLSYVPISICGGSCALVIGVMSHLTDVTTQSERATRLSYLEAATFVGILLGSMSSSYILQLTSPTFVFGISGLLTFVGVLYVIFCVDESIQQDESIGKFEKFKAIFDLSLVTDMLQTCFKRRDNWNRSIIWMTVTSMVLGVFALEGSLTVFYLFVREKFDWTIKQSTFFDSANILIMIVGNILGIYVMKKLLRVSDANLAIVSYLSSFADYLIKAFATQQWHLYLATSIALFRGISSPMCRAILSNAVPVNEIGKLYSLTTSLESISPLGSAPLYSFVYANTLNTFPGTFNLISAGVNIICVVLLFIVYICLRRHPPVGYVIVAQ